MEPADSSGTDGQRSRSGYRVIVRVRPLVNSEQGAPLVAEVLGQSKLRVIRDGQSPLLLKFDKVLGQDAKQSDVFRGVRDLVTAAVEGRSGAIIAYGQTGSGKTHTMC